MWHCCTIGMIMLNMILSWTCYAQPIDLNFRYLNQKHGLSNTFVTDIVQDSTGYIWVGTINGLNRFDGIQFESFYANEKDSNWLTNNYISTLYVDRKGVLWVGTHNGIHSFDKYLQNFNQYSIANGDIEHDLVVSCIAEDEAGDTYCSILSCIYKLNRKSHTLDKILSIDNVVISSFCFDVNGDIYVGVSNSVTLYKYDTIHKTLVDVSELVEGGFGAPVKKLGFENDRLWIATLGDGLWAFDRDKLSFKHFPVGLPDTDNVVDFYRDIKGRFWIIDYTGLKLLDVVSGSYYSYYYYNEDPYSIRELPIVFFQDNHGNNWVGHNGAGVGFMQRPNGIELITNSKTDFWSLSQGNVHAITKDHKGNLLIACGIPEITMFDYADGDVKHYRHNINDSHSLGSGTIFSLFQARDNTVWVGTYEGGLQKFDSDSEKFETYQFDRNNPYSIGTNDVRSIDEDADGNLWLVVYGRGIDKFDRKTNQFHHFDTHNAHLPNSYVNNVLCANNGDIWAATVWGLSCKRKGNQIFENYYANVNDSTSISSNNVFVVQEDNDGNIWVGTDNGLNRYNPQTNGFDHFNKKFLKQSICGIQSGDDGELWISTYVGLASFNPTTGLLHQFIESIEVNNNSFIPSSSYKDKEGHIYFGGAEGITHFTPSNVVVNNQFPPLVIKDIKVAGKNTDPRKPNSIFEKHPCCTNYFEVNHDDNIISFEYIGLNYSESRRNQYSYMLEGLHTEWQTSLDKRSAVFTNLSPGLYTFKLRVSDIDGRWNDNFVAVKFKVRPPWYQSKIFKLNLVLFIGLLIWLTLQIHSHRLIKQKHLLSLEVERQTKELKNMNKELLSQTDYLDKVNKLLEERQIKVQEQSEKLEEQSRELQISNKKLSELNTTQNRLFSIIAHDLINPFTSILGTTDLLRMPEIVEDPDQRIALANSVNVSANRVFDLLQNLLLWAKSQTKEVKFKKEQFNVKTAITDSTAFLIDSIDQKGINFAITCDDDITAYGDMHMFKTVVRNLTGNAVKFTNTGGTVKVNAKVLNKEVIIDVIDNGIGIRKEKLENLFDMDVLSSTKGTEGEMGSGMGLLLCKEFIGKNEGSLRVNSVPNQETVFSFTIPMA